MMKSNFKIFGFSFIFLLFSLFSFSGIIYNEIKKTEYQLNFTESIQVLENNKVFKKNNDKQIINLNKKLMNLKANLFTFYIFSFFLLGCFLILFFEL